MICFRLGWWVRFSLCQFVCISVGLGVIVLIVGGLCSWLFVVDCLLVLVGVIGVSGGSFWWGVVYLVLMVVNSVVFVILLSIVWVKCLVMVDVIVIVGLQIVLLFVLCVFGLCLWFTVHCLFGS